MRFAVVRRSRAFGLVCSLLDDVEQLTDMCRTRQLFVRESNLEVTFELHDEAHHIDRIQSELFGKVLIVRQRIDGFTRFGFKEFHQCLTNLIARNHDIPRIHP